MPDSLRPHELQDTWPPCPSPTPKAHPNPGPLSRWCHPTISSSVIPFSFCPQSFPALGAFPLSWLFVSGGKSIGASASVLPMNIQGWFHLGLPIPKKGSAKECSNYHTIALISNTSKVMLKILKPGFSNTWTVNFQMFNLVLEQAEEPEIKLPTSAGSSKKQESSRITCQSLWLCGSQ